MGKRFGIWLRILGAGVKPLDMVARWIAVAVLLLGLAGITVTFVFHLPWPWALVILSGLLLLVVVEGAYRVWHTTDQERLSAEAGREAAQRELEAQREAHALGVAEGERPAAEASRKSLQPHYLQRAPYRLQNANMIHHRIGILNPAGNPEATGVRLQLSIVK